MKCISQGIFSDRKVRDLERGGAGFQQVFQWDGKKCPPMEAQKEGSTWKIAYVAGRDDNAVAVFSRDSGTGALTFVEAQIDGADGVDGIGGAIFTAVSPDGKHSFNVGNPGSIVSTSANGCMPS